MFPATSNTRVLAGETDHAVISRRTSRIVTLAVALIEAAMNAVSGKTFAGRPHGTGAIVLREKRAKARLLSGV